MSTHSQIFQIGDYYTLGSNLRCLAVKNTNGIALFDIQEPQPIFVRNKSSEEYRYISPFFEKYGYVDTDMIVQDGSTIRIIQMSKSELGNRAHVPSILINASDSEVKWERQEPQHFEDFGLNLPCYVTHTRNSNTTIFLQGRLIADPKRAGVHVVYGRDGYCLFQIKRHYNSKPKKPYLHLLLCSNSHGLLDVWAPAPVFGYGDDKAMIMCYQDGFEFKNPTLVHLPNIQTTPFFFIIMEGTSTLFGPLITPLCGYLKKGRFFWLTPEKEFHTMDFYKTIITKDVTDVHPVNIVRNSEVVATYILVARKNSDGTDDVGIYRLDEDFIPKPVYALREVEWFGKYGMPAVGTISQDCFYTYYYKRTGRSLDDTYGILMLNEDGVYRLDTREIEKAFTLSFPPTCHFWPNPNVVALCGQRKVALIRGTEVVKIVDVGQTRTVCPFFCAGKKLYVFSEIGETEVYHISAEPNEPPKHEHAMFLWEDEAGG